MAPVTTPAIVLHQFPYGETSKIVRLATPAYGLVSAIAKGAQRPKSRFGARLQALSAGTAQLYLKPNRDLQTLAEFDVETGWGILAHDVDAYASACAVAEVVLRLAPPEPHPELFVHLRHWLELLAGGRRVRDTSLTALWSVVTVLGFSPALDACAVDGRELAEGSGEFALKEGGFVCGDCARSRRTQTIGGDDRVTLARLAAGELPLDPGLSPRHAAAHRRLLARFIHVHVAEGRALPAVDFWEGLPWTATS